MKQPEQESEKSPQFKPKKLSSPSPTKANGAPSPKSKQHKESTGPNRRPGPEFEPKRAAVLKESPPAAGGVIIKSDRDKMRNIGDEKRLEKQVMVLRQELERVNRRNVELVSKNLCLTQQLATALAKIDYLQKEHLIQDEQTPNFKAKHLLIATKLEQPRSVKSEPINVNCLEPARNDVVRTKIPEPPISSRGVPPPPPPPPRVIPTRKASPVEALYHSLSKRAATQVSPKNGNFNKQCVGTSSAHNSIVGEIQNRSSHLLAIKSDIETKGEFINGLIEKVMAASFADIEDVASFVDWLDKELLCLADERAVLKHFKWPEKKADTMREAAIEYSSLQILEKEVSSYSDDSTIPYCIALKRMASLLDKSERSIQRIITLRDSVMRSYQDHDVPINWLLDFGLISKIKKGSRQLAKKYVDRLKMELQSNRHSERESAQETLLLQGVHFAYKTQQIAGGLDTETLCAIEDMRRWVPSGNLQGSQELLLS